MAKDENIYKLYICVENHTLGKVGLVFKYVVIKQFIRFVCLIEAAENVKKFRLTICLK